MNTMLLQSKNSIDGTNGIKIDRASYLARAQQVIPGGASAGGRRVYQDTIVRTEGAYLWNADGRRFIDYLLAYGPIVIGHSDLRINEAVIRTASTNDLHWVGPQANEVELAETIVELVPSAEKVAFVTSGSDALLHAVHVARGNRTAASAQISRQLCGLAGSAHQRCQL